MSDYNRENHHDEHHDDLLTLKALVDQLREERDVAMKSARQWQAIAQEQGQGRGLNDAEVCTCWGEPWCTHGEVERLRAGLNGTGEK